MLSAALLVSVLSLGPRSLTPARADEALLQGTISTIDPTRGRIELITERGLVTVYLSPEQLQDLEEGDQVTIHRAMTEQEAYERDMEQRFPHTAQPNEDIPTKSKQVGS